MIISTHAKSAKATTNNHFPSFPSSQNQKSFPLRPLRATARPGNAGREQSVPHSATTNLPFRPWRPWRGQSVLQSPITNLPFRPASAPRTCPDPVGARVGAFRPLREQSAFSLTEVVIAMGVAAVAFTSIIALFPLGLGISKETFETTQAALITQSIMNQILDVQGGSTNTGFRRIIVTTNNDPTVPGNLASFNVNSYNPATNLFVFYTNYVNPTNGQISWKPGGEATTNDWQNGKINSLALARVTLRRILTGGTSYDIHGVEVQVDYPGSAKLTNRTHEIFSRICH